MSSRIAHVVRLCGVCAIATPALASHIPLNLNRAGLRTGLVHQGYLHFRGGEERNGWMDARHPNLAGARDAFEGYDRSQRFFAVDHKIVTDQNGAPLANTASTVNISRDYDVANKVWVQSGVSILNVAQQNVNVNYAGALPVASPDAAGPVMNVMTVGRAAAPTINSWFVPSITGGTRGFAAHPQMGVVPAGNPQGWANHGVVVRDDRVADTFAHEVGHFITMGLAEHMQAGGANNAHSLDQVNLLADGGWRWHPGLAQNGLGLGNPGFNIPSTLEVIGRARSTDAGTGAPKVGGIDQIEISQTQRVFGAGANPNNHVRNNYLQTLGDGLSAKYASRADLQFVEDSYDLEDAGGIADNTPGARDSLLFGIGGNPGAPVAVPPTASNGGMDQPWDPLAMPMYTQDTFHFVDVCSVIARYADNDTFGGPNSSRSLRESSLDYMVRFSFDGANYFDGVATDVFVWGWTIQSAADDYLARWAVPLGDLPNGAKFIRIQALRTDGHDGSAQIDAVIAGFIPTPGAGALLALAGVLVLWTRRRA